MRIYGMRRAHTQEVVERNLRFGPRGRSASEPPLSGPAVAYPLFTRTAQRKPAEAIWAQRASICREVLCRIQPIVRA